MRARTVERPSRRLLLRRVLLRMEQLKCGDVDPFLSPAAIVPGRRAEGVRSVLPCRESNSTVEGGFMYVELHCHTPYIASSQTAHRVSQRVGSMRCR